MVSSCDTRNRILLDKARKLLAEANAILAIRLYDVVGRTAYLAGFHAAQAFISERTGKSVKTHKGVHAELYRLTRDNPLFDPELQSFLSRNYDLKAIADYEIGPEAEVSADRANLAVLQAKRLVAHFESVLGAPSSEKGTAP